MNIISYQVSLRVEGYITNFSIRWSVILCQNKPSSYVEQTDTEHAASSSKNDRGKRNLPKLLRPD